MKNYQELSYCYKAVTYETIISNLENCTISDNNNVSNIVIEELKQIQKKFLWDNEKLKNEQNTLRSDYKDGGLKSVDIEDKIICLKCSWVKWLYTFHASF